MRIAIVTQRKEALSAFAEGLASHGVTIDWIAAPQDAVDQARMYPRDMVILDDQSGNFRACLSDLLMANALIHTAVITAIPPEQFHEESEGLGVLCSLPPSPRQEHADELVEKLRGILGL